ncbi:AraC-type DNA-binding domain-containing protein [Candidatus Sulfopaludibacter sp. SbA3]|nr:AraC-type DNA-binding domain-containing protein [Candidatus Sulfopaludibacter sp. SbA3]
MSNSRHPDSGVAVRSFGVTFPDAQALGSHHRIPPPARDWHQLIYATRGAVTVRTATCAWMVPPHRGVWIPAGFDYRLEMSGVVALRTLYITARPKAGKLFGGAEQTCCVVNVSPLLRELILRIVHLGALDAGIPRQRRLIGVLFDELHELTAVPLQLPMPQDGRAAQFAALAAADPGGKMPVAKMLRKCAASRRTMERLFHSETAMSLGQWLRRQKLLHALRRLAAGESVNAIALELGYNSPSAFIAMFKRELGQTPTRYFE